MRAFPENEIVLQKINEMTEEFNQTYVMIQGFEMHVVQKIEDLYNYAVEVLNSAGGRVPDPLMLMQRSTFQALLCANPIFREFHDKNKHLSEFKEIVEV